MGFRGDGGRWDSTLATLPFAPFSGNRQSSSMAPNEAQLPGLPLVVYPLGWWYLVVSDRAWASGKDSTACCLCVGDALVPSQLLR